VSEDLFRFPAAGKRDLAVEAWIRAQETELGAMALGWITQLRKSGTDVRELLHDGGVVMCVDDVAFAYVNTFTSHMNVGFYFGAFLDDPAGMLEGTGKRMRHVKLRQGEERDLTALTYLIEDAYADVKRRMGT
jgi:hypothetical protein